MYQSKIKEEYETNDEKRMENLKGGGRKGGGERKGERGRWNGGVI